MFKPVKTHSKSTYISFPGSESIQFDMEKLFLLSVSKENLDLIRKIRKNHHYEFYKVYTRISRVLLFSVEFPYFLF